MEALANIKQEELTKQERLWLWLRRHNIKNTTLARLLGVKKNTVGDWLQSETMPVGPHFVLTALQIVPKELLPSPVFVAVEKEGEEEFVHELQRRVARCAIKRASDVFTSTSSDNCTQES